MNFKRNVHIKLQLSQCDEDANTDTDNKGDNNSLQIKCDSNLIRHLVLNIKPKTYLLQGNPFIMLCLESIEQDRVISEPCYKKILL